jgi:rhodanese-related sulfurtransferase
MTIRPADLLAQIESGGAPAIVDVRSRHEYLAGHVPGAMHIPFWAVGWRTPEIRHAADSTVVVYCLYGPRAWMGGALLRLRGFRKVTYLKGHWAGWRRQRLRDEVGDRRSSAAG